MPHQPKQPPPGQQGDADENTPRPSPQSDPTHPQKQESVGKWVPAEQNVEEPGRAGRAADENAPS